MDTLTLVRWFAGSLRSCKRAAATLGLIQSARMDGHNPYGSLKDDATAYLARLEIGLLLPHQRMPI